MSDHLISRIGPQQYLSEPGAYNYLPEFLRTLQAKRILLLHGTKSWQKAVPYLPDLEKDGFAIFDVKFGGECSKKEIERVAQKAKYFNIDAIIGLGGGKVIDTAKAAAASLDGCIMAILPTLASNCAAWSALSVIYKDKGITIGHTIFPRQANLTLIEPRVIFDSPIEFFIAGIADTLAKWYETETILAHVCIGHLSVLYAQKSAEICRDIPLKYAIQAVKDMTRGVLSEIWQLVMETNIIAGGLVGGFGDKYGRATAAHSVHDALTHFPETVNLLHGVKVAYGIMVQLALENKWEEIQRLQSFYRQLHLPLNLRDLHFDVRIDKIHQLAAYTAGTDKSIHFLPFNVTESSVFDAIQQLENIQTTSRS